MSYMDVPSQTLGDPLLISPHPGKIHENGDRLPKVVSILLFLSATKPFSRVHGNIQEIGFCITGKSRLTLHAASPWPEPHPHPRFARRYAR